MDFNAEIARQDGAERRRVYVRASPERVTISSEDTGPAAKLFWGREDYEQITTVLPEAYPALIFALLREKYVGRPEAQREFAAFCKEHGVPWEYFDWSSE
jgi:hypothetical protein